MPRKPELTEHEVVELGDIVKARPEEELYDDTPDAPNIYDINLNDGLEDWEVEEALSLYPLSRGIAVVTGEVGSGKGLLSTALAYKIRRYFKGKKILMDYRPRKLFDLGYEDNRYNLFDETTFVTEMGKMTQMAKGELKSETQRKQFMDKGREWFTQKGQVLMKNAVMVLDEGWRYFYNRDPFNPMGMELGGVIRIWRHLDLLMMVLSPGEHELDQFSLLPRVTHRIRCEWMMTEKDTTMGAWTPVKYVGTKGVFNASAKAIPIKVNGRKQRHYLYGEEDIISQDILKNANELKLTRPLRTLEFFNNNKIKYVTLLNGEHGEVAKINEESDRILALQEPLKYEYPQGSRLIVNECMYHLFNSKNAVAMKPRHLGDIEE